MAAARALTLCLVLAGLALAGCTSSSGGPSASTTSSPSPAMSDSVSAGVGNEVMVEMHDNTFGDNQTIHAHDSIMFMNEGQKAHTVTIHYAGGPDGSPPGDPLTQTRIDQTLQPQQTVTFRFDDVGTYHVWCKFHGAMTSGMHMVVTVT